MSDEHESGNERDALRTALRFCRDGAGEAGLEKVFKELGVRNVNDIRGDNVEKAITLAKAALDGASARAKGKTPDVQAKLNAMADDLYAKRRGVKVD